jgi:hypothetical protein
MREDEQGIARAPVLCEMSEHGLYFLTLLRSNEMFRGKAGRHGTDRESNYERQRSARARCP